MIDVPGRIHCNTGEQEEAYRQIESYFERVMGEIGMPTDSPSPYEIRVHSHERSDDATHTLLYKDQPVATVLETRDIGNFINFTFMLNLEGLVE